MTVCNMSIEAGARAGMIAPDDDDVRVPEGPPARAAGRGLGRGGRRLAHAAARDEGATFDREETLRRGDAGADDHLRHQPGHGHPDRRRGARRRAGRRRDGEGARATWGSTRGKPLLGHKIDVVFIGSCTNSRISDLRAAAAVLQGPQGRRRRARAGRARLAARSRRQAEAEGLDRVFRDAGAEWREAGCSMCIAMNGDQLKPGQYAVSTSNRNFEGRQGAGGRTFLASPLTAAAAAVTGSDHRRPGARRRWNSVDDVHLDAPSFCPIENVDTDQIIPARFLKATSKTGLGEQAVRRLALRRRRRAEAGLRAQPAGGAGRAGAGRGRQLRLRLVARARAVGAARLRLPRRRQHVDRRHLPQQRAQERPPADRRRRRRLHAKLLAAPGAR